MQTATNIFTNFIEFGWSWGPDYTPSGRIWFIGWRINGTQAQYYNGGGVAINQYDNYSMRDANRDTVWDLKFNGTDVGPNLNHNFTNGNAQTLDEVETDCDTGWGLFTNLERCISQGCANWWDWHTLKCRYDDNNEYHLDKTNDTQHYVRTGQSASGCAGATGGG